MIVIPLGEAPAADVVTAVERHFGPATFLTREVGWLDRNELRKRPMDALGRLLGQAYTDAVLVAPDLNQPRLKLTSLLLGLTRAAKRWRIDLHGRRERFHLLEHLAKTGPGMLRHVVACALALVLAEPILGRLEPYLRPRSRRAAALNRLLYLRSQFWLGLEGGGSVAHTAGVIGGLQQLGVEVRVVASDCLAGVDAPTQVVPPETWFDGVLRELEELAYNVPFFFAALRVARETRPGVIYQRHTGFNCCGAVLSRWLGVPLVLEFNSSELWKGQYWGGLHLRRIAEHVESINLRAADTVVVVSRALRDQLSAQGVMPEKILVNPNAVDPRQFNAQIDGTAIRNKLEFSSSDVVVGFSGTFGLWHGIPTLADCMPRVLAARPNVRWLLIGDGPLRDLIDGAVGDDQQLADTVRRPGLVPHADMPAWLAACDVLVSPHGRQADGREFFGSPTKLFEYMATGRPIVASAVGQIAEVLHDEETALLVPPDDPDALTHAIVRLVDQPELRSRLGDNARRAAEHQHTWRQNAERLVQRYGASWSP